MSKTEGSDEQKDLIKANIFNRIIAKTIDFIIIWALLQIIPKAGYFAGLVYLLIGDSLLEGRSVGKKLMGIRVVSFETAEICTIKLSVIRNFPLAVSYILMKIPLIGFIFPLAVVFFEGMLIIGNEKGRRLGDEIAKTQVIEDAHPVLSKEGGSEGERQQTE